MCRLCGIITSTNQLEPMLCTGMYIAFATIFRGRSIICSRQFGIFSLCIRSSKRKTGEEVRKQVSASLNLFWRLEFTEICDENAKDLEQFAYLLYSAVISLHEAGKHNELRDSFLYITLQRKLPNLCWPAIIVGFSKTIYRNQ